MRKIKYFDKELTAEEYIRRQLTKNAGTDNLVMKQTLIDRCNELGVPVIVSMTKSDLLDQLVGAGVSWQQLAIDYGVGVTTFEYQREFGIDHAAVKKLERRGLITVVGKSRFRGFGRNNYIPLYDAFQFAGLTADQMAAMLDQAERKGVTR